MSGPQTAPHQEKSPNAHLFEEKLFFFFFVWEIVTHVNIILFLSHSFSSPSSNKVVYYVKLRQFFKLTN